jgi:hypothetical protein
LDLIVDGDEDASSSTSNLRRVEAEADIPQTAITAAVYEWSEPWPRWMEFEFRHVYISEPKSALLLPS